jgi:hypothetical protein
MNKPFNYTYTAPTEEERKEITLIRKQYQPIEKTESKLDRLRRLDSAVKNTPIILSLILGIVGCLIFGLGLTLILEWNIWLWGVIGMCVGAIPMAIAYPVYLGVLNANKRKYGAEILQLSEELLNEK